MRWAARRFYSNEAEAHRDGSAFALRFFGMQTGMSLGVGGGLGVGPAGKLARTRRCETSMDLPGGSRWRPVSNSRAPDSQRSYTARGPPPLGGAFLISR